MPASALGVTDINSPAPEDFFGLTPLVQDPESSAPIRLLVFADGPGATQVISFALPLQKDREQGAIQMLMLNEADFEAKSPLQAKAAVEGVLDRFTPTHVVVSRFAGQGASALATALEERGLPYVMHLDDNLFGVPEELGPAKYEKYNAPVRLNRLRLMCERASKIYTSTSPLKTQLEAMGVRAPIVAGDVYCAAWIEMAQPAFDGPPVFGYMGTGGHAADLAMVTPAIVSVLRANPDARFEIFGSIKMPRALRDEFPDRIGETKASATYLDFLEIFKGMNWRCGLAPLQASAFNACKANTKFIEYTLAGIPTIASDINVYRADAEAGSVLLAADTASWQDQIQKCLLDQDFAAGLIGKAQAQVKTDYPIDRLRDQVFAILQLPT